MEADPIEIGGKFDRVFLNNRYQVNVSVDAAGPKGEDEILCLSIKRRDKAPIRNWRHFQRIKNEIPELVAWGDGQKCEGVELYPAESRLVDTANQYFLWVLPEEQCMPFGFWTRVLTEVQPTSGGSKGRQQPWPEGQVPEDALSEAEIQAKLTEAYPDWEP